jgi:hypothetical protein
MALDYQMHREDLASKKQIAEQTRQANIQKAQAQSIGRAFERNDKAAQ